jgi:hypothetical protein
VAGFAVTLYGRFWVTPEALVGNKIDVIDPLTPLLRMEKVA